MNGTPNPLVRQWLYKAYSDLESARGLASPKIARLDTAIYHCQQAAEKAIKGFLVLHGIEPDWTHDIARLIRDATPFEASFADLLPYGAELTPYATAFRYLGESVQLVPTREEFDSALDAAERIYNFVLSVLPADVHP